MFLNFPVKSNCSNDSLHLLSLSVADVVLAFSSKTMMGGISPVLHHFFPIRLSG